MNFYPVTEPRKKKRISLEVIQNSSFCDKILKYRKSHDPQEFSGGLESISEHGVFVKTSHVPERGDLLFFGFHFYGRKIMGFGQVIYVNRVGGGYRPQGFGLKFIRVPEEDQSIIKKAIDFISARLCAVRH